VSVRADSGRPCAATTCNQRKSVVDKRPGTCEVSCQDPPHVPLMRLGNDFAARPCAKAAHVNWRKAGQAILEKIHPAQGKDSRSGRKTPDRETGHRLVQTARRGCRNATEGSMAAATGTHTEPALAGVAKAGPGDLGFDHENHPRRPKLLLRGRHALRRVAQLDREMQTQAAVFEKDGGFTENPAPTASSHCNTGNWLAGGRPSCCVLRGWNDVMRGERQAEQGRGGAAPPWGAAAMAWPVIPSCRRGHGDGCRGVSAGRSGPADT
jgi:hypothetical protein